MRNKVLVFFILTTLGLAVATALLWRALRRTRADTVRTRVALEQQALARQDQEARLKAMERHTAQAARDAQELAALATMLRSSESQAASNIVQLKQRLAGAGPANAAGASDGESSGLAGGPGMGEMLSKMLKDPSMKELIRGQQKTMVHMMYGGLFKELNLPPAQQDQLTQLFLDQQMKAVENAGALFQADGADKTAAAEALAAQKKETDAQIKALLGEEKYAQYEEYQKNLGDRMQLSQFQQRLQDGQNALREEQSRQLLAIMKEERARVPPVIPENAEQSPQDLSKALTEETMTQHFAWQEDFNRRVAERVGQVLTPEQRKEFEDFQAQQLSMQKFGVKMARGLFGGSKTGPEPVPPPAPKPGP